MIIGERRKKNKLLNLEICIIGIESLQILHVLNDSKPSVIHHMVPVTVLLNGIES